MRVSRVSPYLRACLCGCVFLAYVGACVSACVKNAKEI